MDRRKMLALLDKLENIEHKLSLQKWAELLWQYRRREHYSRGLASPVRFRDEEHRLQVYAERRRRGFDVTHPSDTHP